VSVTYPYIGPVYHDSGNGNLPITRIVVHCTVGADATGAMGTVKYFKSAEAGGSAHAVADSDEVLVCAYDEVVCWHAPPNTHSLGIELCCSLTNKGEGHWTQANHIAMMKQAARWVAVKCIKHNVPVRKLTVAQVKAGEKGICGHWDVTLAFGQSSHTDPEKYFPWTQFMGYVADSYKELTGTTNPEDDMTTPTDVVGVDTSDNSPMLMGELAARMTYVYSQTIGNGFLTPAVMRANMQAEIEEYMARFWAAPSGTGTALISTINGIAKMQLALASSINDLKGQITQEDVDDDAALTAAKDELNQSITDLKSSVDAMKPPVQDVPKA